MKTYTFTLEHVKKDMCSKFHAQKQWIRSLLARCQLEKCLKNPAQVCLEYCQTFPECRYFTQYEDSDLCFALRDCPVFSESSCVNCVSGESGCSGITCNVEGGCVGPLLGGEYVEGSAADCADLCAGVLGCLWWTYHGKNSLCTFYSSCEEINLNCDSCLTGEAGCGSWGGVKPPNQGMERGRTKFAVTWYN